MIIAVAAVSLLFLAAASYFDLRDGEIPDEVSLAFSAVMLAFAVFTLVVGGDITAVAIVVAVGAAFFLFGYALFRLGQWGGGDVKVLAGVGLSLALLNSLGFAWSNVGLTNYGVSFFLNMGVASIPYIILYSVFLTAGNPRVISAFKQTASGKKFLAALIIFLAPAAAAHVRWGYPFNILFLMPPAYLLLAAYLKSVEREALQKTIMVAKLMEGDVLAEDLIVDGRKIESKRSIEGITREKAEEIRLLAKYGAIPAEIRIKWGVKFLPIIALAYTMTLYAGNTLEAIVYSILT